MEAPYHPVLPGTPSCSRRCLLVEVRGAWRTQAVPSLQPQAFAPAVPFVWGASASSPHACPRAHTQVREHTHARAHTLLAPLSLRLRSVVTSFLSIHPLCFPSPPKESQTTFLGLPQSRYPRKVQRVHAKTVLAAWLLVPAGPHTPVAMAVAVAVAMTALPAPFLVLRSFHNTLPCIRTFSAPNALPFLSHLANPSSLLREVFQAAVPTQPGPQWGVTP